MIGTITMEWVAECVLTWIVVGAVVTVLFDRYMVRRGYPGPNTAIVPIITTLIWPIPLFIMIFGKVK